MKGVTMKKLYVGLGVLGVLLIADPLAAHAETTQDHFKTVINKQPHQVEVCYDQQVGGDKSGDMLKGAIIGGIIGNNVGDIKNGGAAGAIIGGILGHNNSTATGGTRQVCRVETRYTETPMTVYSHSTVTFTHHGKTYTVRFQK